jgi:hypothetical protein
MQQVDLGAQLVARARPVAVVMFAASSGEHHREHRDQVHRPTLHRPDAT